jgi:hypothetical protein
MSCVVIIHHKDILFPGGTDSSWRCARRYRRTTHLDGPMPAPQRRHQGRIGSRTLSPQQHSSSKSAHPDYCTKMRVAACSGVGNRVVWSAPARPKRTWSCPSCEFKIISLDRRANVRSGMIRLICNICFVGRCTVSDLFVFLPTGYFKTYQHNIAARISGKRT